MAKRMSTSARDVLIEGLRERYQGSTIKEKGRILDEFTAVSGYHRKHTIRLLSGKQRKATAIQEGRKIYDEAVKQALIIVWEASDRICSKRLKPLIPNLVAALERHGHLRLDEVLRGRLMDISPATIDRLLYPVRTAAGAARKRRSMTKLKKRVPVKTHSDWDEPQPGYFECDFVVHAGGSMAGHPIHTMVITDVASSWTDYIPLLAREQSLVTEALDVFREQLPIPMLGLNTDNDSAFINDTLISYCTAHGIEFTRSRPRRKNDQAWIEQKNGSIIRKIAGHDRYDGVEAGRVLCRLYGASRLFTNFFQPSFKLQEKHREGSRVRKVYDTPATPCERLLAYPMIDLRVKENLRRRLKTLDPVLLLKEMREAQASLSGLNRASTQSEPAARQSTEEFVSQLSELWKLGEARPTHRKGAKTPRTWRTRKDPYEAVMPQIMEWLEAEPDRNAKDIFRRLQNRYPGEFKDGQLRTLQRRVKSWRREKARALLQLYSYSEMNGDSSVQNRRNSPTDC